MSIFEEGDPQARICLIGEAPAASELREGRPFVGPAGTLLEQCLHAAGIARAECYILNVFEDRVFKTESSGAINDRLGNKLWAPSSGFTELGKERSKATLERAAACGANVIVPVGGTAYSLLCGTTQITKWRGSIVRNVLGRKSVGTLHPSGALQGQYVWRYLIAADLKRAKDESLSPEIILPQRTYAIDPSFGEIARFAEECQMAPVVATDIEVIGGHISCFSLAISPNYGMSVPLIDAGFEPRWTADEEVEIWRMYARILSNPEIVKCNQNITLDLAELLRVNHIVPRGMLHDPMIAHSIMNPALSKSLGTLCSLYTREPYYKDDGDLKDRAGIEDFRRYWEYNAKDAVIALECMQVLMQQPEWPEYVSTYERTIAVIPMLVEMMVRGFKINVSELNATRERVKQDISDLVVKMAAQINRPIITEAPKTAKAKRETAGALNVNSPIQLMKYFYEELKLPPSTKDGRPTIDDKALSRIYRNKRLEFAKMLQDYRGLDKLSGTYLDMKLDLDQRLRCSFNPRGTWTGRLSSSQTVRGTGGNLQNIHPYYRTFIVAG